MGGVLYEPADYLSALQLDADAANHRGIDLQHASWVTAAFQIGGTFGALLLGVLMDRFNPYRVLALSYGLGRSVSS